MFPKKNRITKTEFNDLLKNSRVIQSNFFSLRFIKKDTKNLPKFAFVVSKKVAKNASDRNKLKRRGFHALRDILFKNGSIEITGFTGAFFFKKEAVDMSFEEIKKDIAVLLKKSDVIE